MHSRIFGIVSKDDTDYKNLVKQTNEISEDYMYDLMGDDADYVIHNEKDFNEDLEWLGGWEKFRGEIIGTKLIITKQQVEDYLNEKIKFYQDTVSKMDDIDSFLNNKFGLTNHGGFFVYWDNSDLEDWDGFMECLYYTFKRNGKDKMEFEIVKTWDYHY